MPKSSCARELHFTLLISTNFLQGKQTYVQNKYKGNKTKTNTVKPKMLKTLNMNQFYASLSFDL